MYSLGEAAKAAGVSKTTISKALKSGKLSFIEKTSAGYKIDPSELYRVYPVNGKGSPQSERLVTPEVNPVNSALEREIELLREIVTQAQNERDHAREDATKWQEEANKWEKQATKITALLEDQRRKSKGFWARITGK